MTRRGGIGRGAVDPQLANLEIGRQTIGHPLDTRIDRGFMGGEHECAGTPSMRHGDQSAQRRTALAGQHLVDGLVKLLDKVLVVILTI